MQGVSALGWIHTALSLLALSAAGLALVRHRRIDAEGAEGRAYLLFTALTALTGLFIFSTGRFGPGHAIAVLTLVALVVVLAASRGRGFGRAAAQVQAAAVSATLLFHAIPGLTETLTRLPAGQPLLGRDSPLLKLIHLALLLVFGVAVVVQWRRGRRAG